MEHKSLSAFDTTRVGENSKEIRENEAENIGLNTELPPVQINEEFLLQKASTPSPPMIKPPQRSTTKFKSNEKNGEDVDACKATLTSTSASSISSCCCSDIVPPLDLQSVCFSSPRDEGGYTFYYHNYGESHNTKLKGNASMAFENWLSAKRRIICDKAAARKREEEAKQREKVERKRLAAEKYENWLAAKEMQQQQERLKSSESIKVGPKSTSVVGLREGHGKPPSLSPATATAAAAIARRAKIEAWERNKRAEEETRRKMNKLSKEQRECEAQKRQQLAQEAWDKWVSEAPHKPKPVPLNRGLFTLRGTISDIFINPNEWKSGGGSGGGGGGDDAYKM